MGVHTIKEKGGNHSSTPHKNVCAVMNPYYYIIIIIIIIIMIKLRIMNLKPTFSQNWGQCMDGDQETIIILSTKYCAAI